MDYGILKHVLEINFSKKLTNGFRIYVRTIPKTKGNKAPLTRYRPKQTTRPINT